MPYPVIILGAGASHDYIDSSAVDQSKRAYQPPLTKDLLSPSILNIAQGIIDEYPGTRDLVGEMNSGLRAGKQFEEYLLEVRDRSPERKRQVISFQYYLSALFQLISKKYGYQIGNNYGILVERIKESFAEACFVTFNYDSLLEQSLFPDGANYLSTYISGRYKLVKVHESCDWAYSNPQDVHWSAIDQGVYPYLIGKPDKAETISGRKEIRVETDSSEDYPAIAIPIAGKDKSEFVCPTTHTDQLTEALSKTDRILTVGWAAGDPALIQLIEEHVNRPVSMYVVCGARTNTIKAINDKFCGIELVSIIPIRDNAFEFSTFLNNTDCDEFMSS